MLALDYDRCFSRVGELLSDLDASVVERQIAALHGWHLPKHVESSEFNMIDGRKCLYDDGDMAHVLCEWRGERVSMFVVPGRASRERGLEIMRHDAVIWSKDTRAFALVERPGPVVIDEVPRYVRQYTD